jgi:hypothetical protein
MDSYYGLWCPRCDKPEIKTTQSLNLIKALRYIQANGRPGAYERVWEIVDVSNDTSTTLCLKESLKDNIDDDELKPGDNDYEAYLDVIAIEEAFGIDFDEILWQISW